MIYIYNLQVKDPELLIIHLYWYGLFQKTMQKHSLWTSRVYICCQWLTFLPNMSHRAFVTFSYAAFLETEHLRSSLTFFRCDFSLNCKQILTRYDVYCQQHSFILYPIPQSRWQRYIFDSLLSFWFSYLPSFVKYVKQKDAKVYCFNGRSKSWKLVVLLVWFLKNYNSPLILIPCHFWVMKLNFLPKKPAT